MTQADLVRRNLLGKRIAAVATMIARTNINRPILGTQARGYSCLVALFALVFAVLAREVEAQTIVSAQPLQLEHSTQFYSSEAASQSEHRLVSTNASAQSQIALRDLLDSAAGRASETLLDQNLSGIESKPKLPSFMPAQHPISQIDISVKAKSPKGSNSMPKNYAMQAQADFPDVYAARAEEMSFQFPGRTASSRNAIPYQPLYFEEANLERYGRSCGRLQPAASALRFFATIPVLPYALTLHHPNQNYFWYWPYEAGWAAPRVRELKPFDRKAGLVEAAVLTGLAVLIP